MLYTDVEKMFDFKFPEKFHQILKTGAMEWAEVGTEYFRNHREQYINNPGAFMMINADCELIFTEDYPEYMQSIDEKKEMSEEYDNLTLNPNYRLIPFAFTGCGDLFCFVYEGDSEPFVILLAHDESDYEFYGKNFDEFLYLMMLNSAASSVYDEEDYKTEAWMKHLDYVSDEYRQILENADYADEDDAENESIIIIDREKPEIFVAFQNA